MTTIFTEADKEAMEQRMSRLEHMASLNKKDNDKQFWILMGVTVLTWISIRGIQDRLDKERMPKGYIGVYLPGNKQEVL